MKKKYQLNGKKVFITGASKGIGRALVLELVKNHGCTVLGCARGRDELRKLKAELDKCGYGDKFMYTLLDVGSRNSWHALKEFLSAADFYPDAVINNAGIIHGFANAEEIPPELADRVINTNFRSLIMSAQLFIPMLRRRKGAAMINVISAAAGVPLAGTSVYSASKRAALSFTESLMQELRPSGCYVAAVFSGPVKTDIYFQNLNADKTAVNNCGSNNAAKSFNLIARIGISPHRAARQIIKGITQTKNYIKTDITAGVLVGAYNRAPQFSVKVFDRAMRLVPLRVYRQLFAKQRRKD